jgi:hypothetical protein
MIMIIRGEVAEGAMEKEEAMEGVPAKFNNSKLQQQQET